ncbi:hypothetical protein KGMB02408_29260 [Bacteroides faecalis]|uniref:Uncharacterized protein n=1 Tax=Bacteroides faecalis TaxID=2447885 RepID=A0A401LWT3_9BACE|nr:hypothetical protein KGMB02408_29260 [Bacteroides faecalis]
MIFTTKEFELYNKAGAEMVSYLCISKIKLIILKCRIKIIWYESKSNFMGFIINFNISDYGKSTSKNPAVGWA